MLAIERPGFAANLGAGRKASDIANMRTYLAAKQGRVL